MRSASTLHPEIHDIVGVIVNTMTPSAVICFGHVSSIKENESCFVSQSLRHTSYDLLIITSDTKLKSTEVIDKVSRFSSDDIALHVISHTEFAVRTALLCHHIFFTKIFTNGIILYQAPGAYFEIPDPKSLTEKNGQLKKREQREWERLFELSDRFLATASETIVNEYYDLGVFLLHQAMEPLCIASAKAHAGYTLTTHNLKRLISFVSCYIPEAREIFLFTSKNERKLFNVLTEAYSDVRYKEFYSIPPGIAFSLLERVTEFSDLIKEKYDEAYGFHRRNTLPANEHPTLIVASELIV